VGRFVIGVLFVGVIEGL